MRTYFTEKQGQNFVDAVGMLFYKTAYSFLVSKQGQVLWGLKKTNKDLWI